MYNEGVPNQKKFSTINLVPQDEFDRSIVGKSLKWALTTGKSIVILTEFVVILAFLSRFKLDRDLNDLNEVIIQKQALVDSYNEVEQQMLDLQTRMTLVGEIKNTSVNVADSMNQLAQITPLDTSFDTVELNQKGWALKGVSGTEAGFATLLAGLKSSDKFDNVKVGNVRFDLRKGGLLFGIDTVFPKAPTTVSSSVNSKSSPTPTPRSGQ